MRWPPRLNLPYRPCVAIMLLNHQDQVWIGKRLDNAATQAWQMPQGGIDPGETPEQAALRELKEEIGTDKVSILAKSKKTYKYDLPLSLVGRLWEGAYRGQRQTWFLMRFEGIDQNINIATEHPEFTDWRWAAWSELPNLVIPFKRDVYEAVIEEFKPYLQTS